MTMRRIRSLTSISVCLVLAVAITGCGRTTDITALEYRFEKPPRYDARAYASYAYVEEIDGRKAFADPGWRLPGMDALLDDRKADLVLEVAVQRPRLVGVHTTSVLHQTEGGEHVDYGAEGGVEVPYTYEIYDGIANQELMAFGATVSYPLAVDEDYASPEAATGALHRLAERRYASHRDGALVAARDDLYSLYESEFLGTTGMVFFRLASVAENEPRISHAYHYLLTGLDPESAQRAAAVYREIGYAVVDEDGEPDKHANFAVAYGLACCAFILRDFEEVHDQIRIARTFDVRREADALEALEAAAIDLEDRLAR